jgi:SAM-dependent methyltransferase
MSVCLACGGCLRAWRPGSGVCTNCGSSCREQIPDRPQRESHYAGYYNALPELSPLTAARLGEWARLLLPYKKTGRILEVGCGAGHFLSSATAAGFEAWGTEISTSGLARLKERGCHVLGGPLVELGLPADHFDSVVLFEVLEHVEDPGSYLAESRRVLRKGGLLLLTTPNFGSLSRHLLADRWRIVDPEHLVLFTGRGLRLALGRAGLRPLRVWSRNLDPTELVRGLKGQSIRDGEERQKDVDACRATVAWRPWLRALKGAANVVLSALALGDTLEARAER